MAEGAAYQAQRLIRRLAPSYVLFGVLLLTPEGCTEVCNTLCFMH